MISNSTVLLTSSREDNLKIKKGFEMRAWSGISCACYVRLTLGVDQDGGVG